MLVLLQNERGCDICGVEITDNVKPVASHPFHQSTVFLLGNEAGGFLVIQYRGEFRLVGMQFGWGNYESRYGLV